MNPARQHGFTLVEFSIVLLVIALIVGGVLIGRDLIFAAEIRSQIKQIDSYNTALNVFYNKYKGMPGDLHASEAAAFGFVTRSGTAGRGDGNGIIEGCEPYDPDTIRLGCETTLFWSDLNVSGLIADAVPGASDDYVIANSFEETLLYFPRTKMLADTTIFPVYCNDSGTWLEMIRFENMDGSIGMQEIKYTITPLRAYSVDVKIDDGHPISGNVRTRELGPFQSIYPLIGYFCNVPAPAASRCVYQNAYNLTQTTPKNCFLQARMGGK